MAKKQIIITDFSGGISDDNRAQVASQFTLTRHFDLSKPNGLTPYRDMKADDTSVTDNNLRSFVLLKDSAAAINLFALGRKSASLNYPKIFEKSGDIITSTWAASTTGEGSGGTVIYGTLAGYKTKLYYMWISGSDGKVGSYDPASNTLVETVGTMTAQIGSCRPFFHPKSDTIFFPGKNTLAKVSGSTFTDAVLTLPTDITITSLTDYGNYLAIACAPDAYGNSKVFLWDMILADISESIDFGNGALNVLENIDGTLVGISATSNSSFNIIPELIFRTYESGNSRIFKKIRSESTTLTLYKTKAKQGSKLYFAVSLTLDGVVQHSLMVMGKNQSNSFSISFDRLPNNGTALSGLIDGFDIIGDYLWVAYDSSGAINRTNDQPVYSSATAALNTQKFNGGDINILKTLVGVDVFTAPMTSGQQVVVKYKADSDSGFNRTIYTNTKTGIVNREGITLEPAETNLGDFHEIQFRIESTGGAVITGYKFVWEEIKTLLRLK